MLSSLHIRNYILIDSLDVSFPEGLVIITGQTGAGKSILLGALSLLTGAKADLSVISEGADSCVVEGEFDVNGEEVRRILEDSDVEWNGGNLLVRRVVHSSGRSRSFINDSPVPVTLLSEISEKLVDIHSQHRTMMLSDKAFQLSLLDHYAADSDILEDCRHKWRCLQESRSELAKISASLEKIESERDYNQSQYDRLAAANLREGEMEELEAEQKQLANAEDIKADLCAMENLLNPSQDGLQNIDSALRELEKLSERAGKYIPLIASLSPRIQSSRLELADILDDISTANSRVDISPERLEAVEDRISLIFDLQHKHSCQSISELIALRDKLGEALFDTDALVDRKKALEAQVAREEKMLEDVSDKLSASRKKAAPSFASAVEESLHFLELEKAVFEVEIVPCQLSATGCDMVSFKFSSTGKNPADVAKCASGGEMSRIMLCLKNLMARYTKMPTMIFDEIDTGVSGSAADRMGSMICDMGQHMQVFAITHLPQVAAKGSGHYLVSKNGSNSSIKKLSPEERVQELARMLSGSVVTPEAVANAKSLLGA